MQMNRNPQNEFEPVCSFGPGGDFTCVWKPDMFALPSQNRLAIVLTTLTEIATAILGSEPETVVSASANPHSAEAALLCREGTAKYAKENTNDRQCAHSTTTTTAKSDLLFSDEPMLFPDNRRIGLRTAYKPKHRIRTYRRTTKKRTAFNLVVQGSLFAIDSKSAKTA